ncbi:hypothetical protein ACMHYB_13560 [Sorangium sp. So ce1128]
MGRKSGSSAARSGGRLSSRHGGGAQRGLGLVVLVDAMLEIEEPAPSQLAHHAPDGVLEHLTDLARLQVTELVPHELCAVFVVSPVEKDNVQARRMCGTAAHLVDHVLPDVPVRQWVRTMPFAVRRLLALRPDALTAAGRIFVEEIARWQKQKAR